MAVWGCPSDSAGHRPSSCHSCWGEGRLTRMRPERYSQLTSSCVGRTAKRKSSMKRAKKVTTVMATVAYIPSRECDVLALHEALSSKLSMSNIEPPADSIRHPIFQKICLWFILRVESVAFTRDAKPAACLSQGTTYALPNPLHVPRSLSLFLSLSLRQDIVILGRSREDGVSGRSSTQTTCYHAEWKR